MCVDEIKPTASGRKDEPHRGDHGEQEIRPHPEVDRASREPVVALCVHRGESRDCRAVSVEAGRLSCPGRRLGSPAVATSPARLHVLPAAEEGDSNADHRGDPSCQAGADRRVIASSRGGRHCWSSTCSAASRAGSALEVPTGRAILPDLRRLIAACRQQGVPVIFTQFVYAQSSRLRITGIIEPDILIFQFVFSDCIFCLQGDGADSLKNVHQNLQNHFSDRTHTLQAGYD